MFITPSKKYSFLVVGIFLLIWATNCYFIFGNTGKNFCLLLGFICLVFFGVSTKKDIKFIIFFGVTLVIYLLLYLIGYWNDQKILSPLNLSFSFICFSLLNIGYLVGNFDFSSFKLTKKAQIVFSALAILGSVAFYFSQIELMEISSNINKRDLGDESLNPVGIAYTHALLFLFLFWIFEISEKGIIRLFILIAIISTLSVIVSTLSRGALIFTSLFILFHYSRTIQFKLFELSKFLKRFLIFIFTLFCLSIMLQKNEFIQLKVEAITDRFVSLVDYSTNKNVDASSVEREKMYEDFFNNIPEYFFGGNNYEPYPHNQYIEIFMRWGIFGIPLLLFSISMFFKSIKVFNGRNLESNPILFLIVSLFIFSYLQSMTSMSLEMNRMMWLGFGFLTSFNSKKL